MAVAPFHRIAIGVLKSFISKSYAPLNFPLQQYIVTKVPTADLIYRKFCIGFIIRNPFLSVPKRYRCQALRLLKVAVLPEAVFAEMAAGQ